MPRPLAVSPPWLAGPSRAQLAATQYLWLGTPGHLSAQVLSRARAWLNSVGQAARALAWVGRVASLNLDAGEEQVGPAS